jgi:ammonium transporter, Amt family
MSGGFIVVYVGEWIEKTLRVDDAVGAVAVHGFCGFYGIFLVGIFAGGYPTGINNVETSFGGQLMGMMTFIPLGFLPGFAVSWLLKRFNLLRVPPEVELEGLDMAEFQQDFFPEFERVPETVVLPTGEAVDAAEVLLESYAEVVNGRRPGAPVAR